MVDEGIERFPVGNRQICRRWGGGVLQTALCTPAQLLRVGQSSEIVDGHGLGREGQLAMLSGGRHQGPGARQAVRGEQRLATAVAASGLSDALDLVHGSSGEVANVQQLHNGPGRTAARRRWRPAPGPCAGGEDTGVDEAAGVEGQRPTQSEQLGDDRRTGVTGGANDDVRHAAPSAAVANRVRDPGADVPAAVWGDLGRRQFVGVKACGPLIAAVVPLDHIAAVPAAVTLTTAQKPTGAFGVDSQGTSAACNDRAAVPMARRWG